MSSPNGLPTILELAEEAERVHIVFNNCYANYGTTNAAELAALIDDACEVRRGYAASFPVGIQIGVPFSGSPMH